MKRAVTETVVDQEIPCDFKSLDLLTFQGDAIVCQQEKFILVRAIEKDAGIAFRSVADEDYAVFEDSRPDAEALEGAVEKPLHLALSVYDRFDRSSFVLDRSEINALRAAAKGHKANQAVSNRCAANIFETIVAGINGTDVLSFTTGVSRERERL